MCEGVLVEVLSMSERSRWVRDQGSFNAPSQSDLLASEPPQTSASSQSVCFVGRLKECLGHMTASCSTVSGPYGAACSGSGVGGGA